MKSFITSGPDPIKLNNAGVFYILKGHNLAFI